MGVAVDRVFGKRVFAWRKFDEAVVPLIVGVQRHCEVDRIIVAFEVHLHFRTVDRLHIGPFLGHCDVGDRYLQYRMPVIRATRPVVGGVADLGRLVGLEAGLARRSGSGIGIARRVIAGLRICLIGEVGRFHVV